MASLEESSGLTENDKKLRDNVLFFEPFIVNLINPKDMLSSGAGTTLKIMLGDKDDSDIRTVQDRCGPIKAAEVFFECLRNCQERGVWTAFYDTLSEENYERVLHLLEGNHIKDDISNQNLLKLMTPVIKNKLDPVRLLPYLEDKNCLSRADCELIKAETGEERYIAGSLALLDLLLRSKSRDFYNHFMTALIEEEYFTLVEEIHPGYYAEKKMKPSMEEPMDTDTSQTHQITGSSLTSELNLCEEEVEPKTVMDTDDEEYFDSVNDLSSPGNDPQKDVTKFIPLDDSTGNFSLHYQESATNDNVKSAPEDNTTPKQRETSLRDNSNLAEMFSDEEDEPALQREIQLRSYQQELAMAGLEGKNCIIVAPTGSGKTRVALKIIEKHFSNPGIGAVKKVAFMVNNVALASQQMKACQELLHDQRVRMICGDSGEKLELGLLLPGSDIFVMTAQVLVDSLRCEEIRSVSEFTLMVFDECHHTQKNHPYNAIMSRYLDDKLSQEAGHRLPQIVGLTASVGVGKAKGVSQAMDHIIGLSANMDAQVICTVKESTEELSAFVSVPAQETLEMTERRQDPFADFVKESMAKIEQMIRNKKKEADEKGDESLELEPPPSRKGDQGYSQWISTTRKSSAIINDSKMMRFFYVCLTFLEKYNNALIINLSVRTRDALEYLKAEFAKRDSSKFTPTDKELQKSFDDKLAFLDSISLDPAFKNPKLETLKKLIIKGYKDKPDSRGIVFAKTRDIVMAMHRWMMETPELRQLHPRQLVGQSAAELGGMTQNQQVDVLQYFKNGQHKLLIATSVAEEGLDIQKCNLVVNYDHITNVVAMVQARGRARAEDSQHITLATKGKGTAEKQELNMIREMMMKKAIENLQRQMVENPMVFRKKIEDIQQDAKMRRDQEARNSKRRFLQEGDFELRCKECNTLACFTSDVRTIAESHHVVIVEEFNNLCSVKPHPKPTNYEMSKRGKIICKKCPSDWGIVALYKGQYYYVIKIVSFIVSDFDQRRTSFKKWSQVNFKVHPLKRSDAAKIEKINEHLTAALGEYHNAVMGASV